MCINFFTRYTMLTTTDDSSFTLRMGEHWAPMFDLCFFCR